MLEAKIHPKKTLVPQPITNGVRMWSVPYTQNSSVIAVDAWSPVMEKYRQGEKRKCKLENERVLAGCYGMKP